MDKKIFMDLQLKTQGAPIFIRNAILDQVRKPWRHNPEREDNVKKHAVGHQDAIVLIRDTTGNIDECSLVLWQEHDGYKIVNIVSKHMGALDVKTYNAIVQDFVNQIAKPAAQVCGFEVDLLEPALKKAPLLLVK